MPPVTNVESVKNVVNETLVFMYAFAVYIVDYITETGFLLPLDN